MRVEPASIDDVTAVQSACAEGRRRQRACGTLVWPAFSDAMLLAEIDAGTLYRVMDGDVFLGTFAVAYEDRAVWGGRERGAHVYLHRIARSAAGSSGGLLNTVVGWARNHASALKREGVRMDTAAASLRLISYYERAGFALVGRHVIGPDTSLPAHYHGTEIALLEMACLKRAD